MNLAIDIGNTRIKFALFDEQIFLFKAAGDGELLQKILKENDIKKVIVSSVSKSKEIKEILIGHNITYIELSHLTNVPIQNNYKTKQTLGNDRLANVVGAASLFPLKNVLTIDCGTCIKFDMISNEKEYFGGSISPGLTMRFKALNSGTEQLPELSPQSIDYLVGENSDRAIISGVMNGALAEIEGIINRYYSIYDNLTVIITGGDAKYFENELKYNIFAQPNLTLIGLNEIILHNN